MLLAGLISTASKSKKSAQNLADTKLETEVISQCGSGGLDDYKTSRSNRARMNLGQLGVIEYSLITVPDSVHMGDPAGDAQGKELGERSLDGLEWEESHARLPRRIDGII